MAARCDLLKAVGRTNCLNTPDVALRLGQCLLTAEVDSSSDSSKPNYYFPKAMGTDSTRTDYEDAKAVTEEDSSSSPAAASFLLPNRAGLEEMGNVINVVSSQNIRNPSAQRKLPSSQYKGRGRAAQRALGRANIREAPAGVARDIQLRRRRRQGLRQGRHKASRCRSHHQLQFAERHPGAFFLRGHSNSEIVDTTYDEELDNDDTTSFAVYPDIAWSTTTEPREHLFDKAVTPSDVGKLNRLVIPKQYAEKYLPLDQASIHDKGKGVLLNFEDSSTEKIWRFRFSYWNSSQSYVLTKGWNRFVKEKHLQAGDIVSFERTSGSRRLFITSRRRPRHLLPSVAPPPPLGRCQLAINPLASKDYPHREQLFYAPPSANVQNSSARRLIPCIAGPNSVDLLLTPKSVSDDGKPSSLDFVDHRRSSPSTDGNYDSSSVWLFGVNLQPSTLNSCPGMTVKEDTGHANKSEAGAEVFSGGKRRSHGVADVL